MMIRKASLSRRVATTARTLPPVILLAATGALAQSEPTAEAVRQAARQHVDASGGRMRLDDPTRNEAVELTFEDVHEGVKTTAGGRQVVCVDFRSADGKLYDVDLFVDRADGSEGLVVEDAVVHKVEGKNFLPAARRAELEAKQ